MRQEDVPPGQSMLTQKVQNSIIPVGGGDSNKMKERILGKLMFVLLFALLLSCCRKAAEEDLLIDDGEIFPSTETTEMASDQETAESSAAADEPEGYFLDVPDVPAEDMPLFKTYGNFAEDSSYLYFINGATGTDLGFFTAADKATGELIPLCTREGCTHSDRLCMACVGNSQWDILGMGRAGKKL